MLDTSTIPSEAGPVADDDAPPVEIAMDGPRYRGYRATELAEADIPFEGVAELLWTAAEPRRAWWPTPDEFPDLLRRLPARLDLRSTLRAALIAMAIEDPHREDLARKEELARARRILPQLAALAGLVHDRRRVAAALRARSVAERLVLTLGGRPDAAPLIDRALVICADHPRSVADAAVEAAAAAGCDLYGCLSIGLSTPHGNHIEPACVEIEVFVEAVGSPRWAPDAVGDRLLRGEVIPGFGHALYPAGDPRTGLLMALARGSAPDDPFVRTMDAIVASMAAAGQPAAHVGFGLVALARAAGLERQSAGTVFTLARLAGRVRRILDARQPRDAAIEE